jgi:prepilin-type N-terminal cleavage/methylation domain-containing protein
MNNRENGFTLIEVLISMVVGLIILGALASTFILQRKSYAVQEQAKDPFHAC